MVRDVVGDLEVAVSTCTLGMHNPLYKSAVSVAGRTPTEKTELSYRGYAHGRSELEHRGDGSLSRAREMACVEP